MSFSTHTTGFGLWGLLMFIALGFEVVFASLAFVYTRRLLRLRALPGSDDLNGYQKALRKLRKNEPMSQDEWNLAERIIDIRRSPMAYSVPAAFMTMGIFYVFGSLEYLHGHRRRSAPSSASSRCSPRPISSFRCARLHG